MTMLQKFILLLTSLLPLIGAILHPLRPFLGFENNYKYNVLKNSHFSELAEVLNNPYEFLTSERIQNALLEGNQSSKCWRDWDIITSYQKWEIPKFWDSFAHIGSGLIDGRITYLGQSEECTNVKTGVMPVTLAGFPDTKPFFVGYKNHITDPFAFTVGVCMPKECTVGEVMKIYKQYKNPKKLQPPFVVSAQEVPDIDTSLAGFILSWVVYSIIFVLVAAGTFLGVSQELKRLYDASKALENTYIVSPLDDGTYTQNDEKSALADDVKPPFLVRFLLCFDFYTNLKKILTIPKSTDSNQLKVLNGIRVMSMSWVILGHTILLQLSAYDNAVYALDRSTSLLFQTLTNATPSVDTFFVLSGLLVMLGGLRSVEKLKKPLDGKFWAMFYVHRLARLWPTMILGIFFIFAFLPYMSKFTYSPAFQPYMTGSLTQTCQGIKNWAPTVFFYNNFDSVERVPCINWTWYVANDMQFYILSPLFILAVYKRREIGTGILSLLIFCSCLIVMIISGVKNSPPADTTPLLGSASAQAKYNMDPYWNNILYFTAYCRFHTYGVGLLLGVLLHDLKKVESLLEKLSIKSRLTLIAGAWLLAVVLGLISIYGVYPTANGHPMNRTEVALFNGTFRLLWAFAVSLVITLCCLGYGGVVNTILSSNFWIPLARINYTTYIWHLILLDVRLITIEKMSRFTTISFVLEAAGCLGLIFGSSLPIAAIVETPFINLEKLLLRRS